LERREGLTAGGSVYLSRGGSIYLSAIDYEHYGFEALLEGQRSGRPGQLTQPQQVQLEDIIDSGPTSWGFLSGVWSAPMVARVISEEFGIDYTARHVRRLLHQWGFSVQRPRRKLMRAHPGEQNRWRRYTYPRLKKKPPNKEAN
jgi:transposase